ncbi:hypothetical protein [Kineothrix sedimenti]|uniref:Uncharacterized protein n=1 Tax=Kineothrix sedimenti TaxID=3123317 RepID=A0ABZ3F006_9FIRM
MDVKYAIARTHYRNANSFDFISELAHNYGGEEDIIGYSPLQEALHYNSRAEAINILDSQPEWVKNRNIIISFKESVIIGYYLISE